MTTDDVEERIDLARRHLHHYVTLSQAIASLLAAVPPDATAPTLREALQQLFELVLESTVSRGRDLAKAVGRREYFAERGGAP